MFTPSYGGTFLLFQFYIQRIGFSVYTESSMLGTQRFHFAAVLRSQNWQTSLWYIYWNIANYFSDTFINVKKLSVNLIYNNSFFFLPLFQIPYKTGVSEIICSVDRMYGNVSARDGQISGIISCLPYHTVR